MEVYLGDHPYIFPGEELSELTDHTSLYLQENWTDLRMEMKKLGYLRIRGLHDRNQVLRARIGKTLDPIIRYFVLMQCIQQAT